MAYKYVETVDEEGKRVVRGLFHGSIIEIERDISLHVEKAVRIVFAVDIDPTLDELVTSLEEMDSVEMSVEDLRTLILQLLDEGKRIQRKRTILSN